MLTLLRQDVTEAMENILGKNPGFALSISPINTSSFGNLTLKNNKININPGYFSSKEDLTLLKDALNFSLNLLKSPPLSEFVYKIEKENEIISNPESYIIDNFYSGGHLLGGTHESIDCNFKLKGFKKSLHL